MNRRRLASLFAALVAAMALAACGGDDGGGGGDPRETIDAATLKGIESGNLDLSLVVDVPGKEGGDLDLSVSGPFQGGAKDDIPQLDFDVTATGSSGSEELDFEGGLLLLPNSAYVDYEGTEYEVDPGTFSFAESVIFPVELGNERKPQDKTGCQRAVGEIPVSKLVDDLRGGEGAEVEGTGTTKVSGDLDVAAALDALLDVAEDPACKSQVSAVDEVPSRKEVEAARDEIERGLKSAEIDVYVGEDDIVRRIVASLEVEPRQRSGGGPQRATVDFELTLSEVNEEQEFTAPEGAKPINDLFFKLGVDPFELLGLLEGQGLAELIEGLGSAATGESGRAKQKKYVQCLGEVATPVDLQKCAQLAR